MGLNPAGCWGCLLSLSLGSASLNRSLAEVQPMIFSLKSGCLAFRLEVNQGFCNKNISFKLKIEPHRASISRDCGFKSRRVSKLFLSFPSKPINASLGNLCFSGVLGS